jgi:hypothetical protein
MLRLKECRGLGLDWRQRECETSRDTLVGDENRGRVLRGGAGGVWVCSVAGGRRFDGR